jgi:hypothetical protein
MAFDNSVVMVCAPLSANTGFATATSLNTIRASELISAYSSRLNTAESAYTDLLQVADTIEIDPEVRANTLLELASIQMYRELELNLYRQYMMLAPGDVICQSDAAVMSSRHYGKGLEHLQNRLDILTGAAVSYEVIASAMLDVADWEFIFSKTSSGINRLEQIHAYLISNGLEAGEADTFINHNSHKMLPRYIPPQYQITGLQNSSPENTGFIALEIDMPTTGKPRNIRVLEFSEDTNIQLRNILRNHVRDATFRPLVEEGKVKTQDDLQMRYIYQY